MSWNYVVKESVSALTKSRFSSLLSILSMAVSIFFLGIFILFLINGWNLVQQLKSRLEMEIFLKDRIDEETVNSIRKKLESFAEIDKIIYISKAKALEEIRKDPEQFPIYSSEALDILGENPLLNSFRVSLKPEFHVRTEVERLHREIESLPGIDEILYRFDLLKAIVHYLRIVMIFVFCIGSALVIASILLISNTIRLSIMVKRESIHIMSLVGATPAFIRRPFVLEGALQGAIGAGIEIAGIFIIIKILSLLFGEFDSTLGLVKWGLLLWGVITGSVGSWVAIHRNLRF